VGPKSALVLGASGLVGGFCVGDLLQDESFNRVTVLARRRLTTEHPRLQQHIVDFDRREQFGPMLKADDVFCCLGTTIRKAGSRPPFEKVDYTYVVESAAAAAANGARQLLVVSALGANGSSKMFYNRVKGNMEKAVSRLPFRGVHIFRPSLLLGDRKELRIGEQVGSVVMKVFALLMVGRHRRYRPIHASVVAKAMIETAKKDMPGVHIYESDELEGLAGYR
jgi:uncharacterized protein YbjT (DUF2867 family)